MRIRSYTPHDLPALYRICLQTANSGQDASGIYQNPDLPGHLFAAPYAFFAPETCSVLEDVHGVAGYVVGTADSESFAEWINLVWLPPLRERHPLGQAFVEGQLDPWAIGLIHRGYVPYPCVAEYQAHLHIDLLPRAQGQGWGKRLMARMLGQFQNAGVAGAHLGVGKRNTNALAFYEHLGFVKLEQSEHSLVYGIRL